MTPLRSLAWADETQKLSVVLWVQPRAALLDECLFALTGQDYRPLELLVVTAGTPPDDLDRSLERYSRIEPFDYRVLPVESLGRAQALNTAVARARGRYLTFLTAEQVVYPNHYARLIHLLSAGEAAWAMSGFVRAYVDGNGAGPSFTRWKRGYAPLQPFDLRFFHLNRPICCSLVIDRSRLGQFSLVFSNNEGPVQNDPLFLKLAALFKPAIVEGLPGCEQRMGGGSPIIEPQPEPTQLQAVAGIGAIPARLRIHAAVERGKIQLRLGLPGLYRAGKEISNWCSKFVSGRSLRENLDRLTRSRP